MNVETWLRDSTGRLAKAGIDSARLDCLLLLEDATGKDRAWLLAHPEFVLSDTVCTALAQKLARREHHIPIAYIRGGAEFYGHWFVLDEQVLVPRPESESLLALLRTLPAYTSLDARPTVIDVGTGSGALAISAQLLLGERATVRATDVDPGCLRIAEENANRLHAHVDFLEADLLQLKSTGLPVASQPPEPNQPLIILANLPYVPEDYPINAAARHEPALALFAGNDGLDAFRRLWQQIQALPQQPDAIITESLLEQHKALAGLAEDAGYQLRQSDGLAQLFTPRTS